MNYEQKRLVVRVFLPGPMEKVTDWEAVAKVFARELTNVGGYDQMVATTTGMHTTERPSRVDTGVDLHIANLLTSGDLIVGFCGNDYLDHLVIGEHNDEIAALGFPTEPQEVVETKAEGEAME